MSDQRVLKGKQSGMNNGFGGTGFGNNNGFMQQPQQQQQQQPYGQQSFGNMGIGPEVRELMRLCSRGMQHNNGELSTASLYSYESGNDRNWFGSNTEDIGGEEFKARVMNSMAAETKVISLLLLNKRQGPVMDLFIQAKERFVRCEPNTPPEQIFKSFINDIESKQNLYIFYAGMVGTTCMSDFTQIIMHEGSAEPLERDPDLRMKVVGTNIFGILVCIFLDWLRNNPKRLDIFAQASPMAKQRITNWDKELEIFIGKFNYVSLPHPFKTGLIDQMRSETPGSGMSQFMFQASPADVGRGYTAYQTPQVNHNNHYPNQWDEMIESTKTRNTSYDPSIQYQEQGFNNVNNFNSPTRKKDISEITPFNRHEYVYNDYFIPIPGTDWLMCSMDNFKYIKNALKQLPNSGFGAFKVELCRLPGVYPIFRLNWNEGTYEYEYIITSIEDAMPMDFVLSNPEKILPFVKDVAGGVSVDFDMIEDTKYVDKPSEISSINEIIEKPTYMTTSVVHESTNTRISIKGIYTVLEKRDPNKKLTGFIVPTRSTQIYNLEKGKRNNDLHEILSPLVQRNSCDENLTTKIIDKIKYGLEKINSDELTTLVTHQLTTVVNRWLVECRGYSETNTGDGLYIKLHDIFEDWGDFCAHLTATDRHSYIELSNYQTCKFLKNGFEFLLPKEETIEYLNKRLDKVDDPLERIQLEEQYEDAIVIQRNVVMTILRSRLAPGSDETFKAHRSTVPDLLYMYDEGMKKGRKYLQSSNISMVVQFEKDPKGRLWYVTESDFDPNVLTFRSISPNKELVYSTPNYS